MNQRSPNIGGGAENSSSLSLLKAYQEKELEGPFFTLLKEDPSSLVLAQNFARLSVSNIGRVCSGIAPFQESLLLMEK